MKQLFKLFIVFLVTLIFLHTSATSVFADWNGLKTQINQTSQGTSWTFNISRNPGDQWFTGQMKVGFVVVWCRLANGTVCNDVSSPTPSADIIGTVKLLNNIANIDVQPTDSGVIYTHSVPILVDPDSVFPQYTYPCGRLQADVGEENSGSTIGGVVYYTSGVDCVATATPTQNPQEPDMSLIINAGSNAVAQGTYGNSGLRSDEINNPPGSGHGSNYYNSINVNPQFSGNSGTDTGLVGFAFTAQGGAASGNGIGNLKSLTSGVNGIIAVYAHCGGTPSCASASDSQGFSGGKFYVYYNNSWRGPFDPGNAQNIAGANVFTVDLLTASPNFPVFNVHIWKNAGFQRWATYTFFKQNDSSGTSGEFFRRKLACNGSGLCTSSFLPPMLQKQLYARNTIH